jgi:thiamine-phosphate pyrophosphorylase
MSIKTSQSCLRGLYAITDEQLIAEEHFGKTIELALQGGTRIIQYRDKSSNQQKRFQQASIVRSLCEQYQAICIINDDIELARSVKAHGVHLGQDDASLTKARQALGDNAIIGISCYNDITLAIEAEKNKADYVAFGAMFSSPTKPDAVNANLDIISDAKRLLSIPVCTIGGITDKNIQQLIQHGTDMAAVISSLFSASDIKHTANSLSQHFS